MRAEHKQYLGAGNVCENAQIWYVLVVRNLLQPLVHNREYPINNRYLTSDDCSVPNMYSWPRYSLSPKLNVMVGEYSMFVYKH